MTRTPAPGPRARKALLILLIMAVTMAPGYGGGDSDPDNGGGCGGAGGGGTPTGGVPPSNVSSEAYNDYRDRTATISTGSFSETISGEAYIDRLLGGASNRPDVRLPGYSYFQGVIQAENHITITGQVRVIGAILGADRPNSTASLYSGAMVTTNAHALVGAGEALIDSRSGMRTRIRSWEEIPADD